MSKCQQTPTQTVLEHGESVWRFTQRIMKCDFEGMRIPGWFDGNTGEILNNLHEESIIKEYNILHDCGKPYCLEVDDDGKRHFPNHAEVSRQTYLSLPVANMHVANLIGWDMVLHTATADEIKEIGLTKKDAYTLLITAFAEIHSNAEMFGGIESISFKSKWKKLDRRGKMLLKGGLE
jgi:hypothetical protein